MSSANEGYKYGWKKRPEARSHDRVHFTIPSTLLIKRTIRDCIEETLGINGSGLLEMANREENLNIICRPSQFARFVILRHVKYGEQNNMACLNMRLILPEDNKTQSIRDVSANPNTSGGACPVE